jgi:dipeptidyl-peptidase 4
LFANDCFAIVGPALLAAQGQLADYQRAEKLLPWNIRQLVFEADVLPNWIEHTNRFWYENVKLGRREFVVVDAERNTQTPAFDHSRLADALSRAASKPYSATELPFRSIEFMNGPSQIAFDVEATRCAWVLGAYTCNKIPKPTEHKPGLSPDGKWQAEVKNYNLYLRNTSTGNQIQLTTDGRKD